MHPASVPTPRVRLTLALAGLPEAMSPRQRIALAASAGYHAVQLDAADPATRPRNLDRSARRDLAALIRRSDLSCSGIDLWIPESHFADPATADRAAAAVTDAINLAAEVAPLTDSRAIVSVSLPVESTAQSVVQSLAETAARVGVQLADHHWPPHAPADAPGHRIGVDPAALLLAEGAGTDPASQLSRHANQLASSRLTDLDSAGRVEPGEGQLDVLAYLLALETCGVDIPCVVDTRGLHDPQGAAARIAQRWAARPA